MSARKQNKGPTRKCRVSIGKADPVFAAIGRQKQLWAEWDHATHPEPPLRSAGYPAWEKSNDAAADAYYGALEALVAIKPTTRAGAAALIAH